MSVIGCKYFVGPADVAAYALHLRPMAPGFGFAYPVI